MPPPSKRPEHQRRDRSPLSVAIASLPVLALTAGIPFVNRLEPRILGLPFLLAWIVGWIVLTPACMAVVYQLDQRRR